MSGFVLDILAVRTTQTSEHYCTSDLESVIRSNSACVSIVTPNLTVQLSSSFIHQGVVIGHRLRQLHGLSLGSCLVFQAAAAANTGKHEAHAAITAYLDRVCAVCLVTIFLVQVVFVPISNFNNYIFPSVSYSALRLKSAIAPICISYSSATCLVLSAVLHVHEAIRPLDFDISVLPVTAAKLPSSNIR